ncbi:hypothetical protein OG21DRAFT_1527293 [Imleria badia]|nr:hypothetical protein OG21DRAFT_1527293 [Imleria badia]
MSGPPPNGKFQTVSYVHPNTLVGADIDETSGVKPVITDGATKVSIQNGQDVLGDKWYSAADGDQVVVKTSVDPGTRMDFRAMQECVYVIKSVDGNSAWTTTGVTSGDPVVLKLLNVLADQCQMWLFNNVAED